MKTGLFAQYKAESKTYKLLPFYKTITMRGVAETAAQSLVVSDDSNRKNHKVDHVEIA